MRLSLSLAGANAALAWTRLVQRFDTLLRICFLRKNKTLRALLLSNTARSQLEPLADGGGSETGDAKDVVTERIEAALAECELGAKRAVQLPVEEFLRCAVCSDDVGVYNRVTHVMLASCVSSRLMETLQVKGVVFRPSTTRHFRD